MPRCLISWGSESYSKLWEYSINLRQLGINQKATQSSLEKLSSGLKINSAADDAAGLAISEKMRGQISGLNQASANAQTGINMVSTAEGALNETTSVLQRMRELAVQAGNDTNTTSDRSAMQTETTQLVNAINDIANTTQFNTQNLLTGKLGLSTSDGTNIQQLSQTPPTKSGTLSFNTATTATLATAATSTLTTVAGSNQVQTADSLTVVANGKTYQIGTQVGQTFDDLATQMSSITGLNVKFTAGATSLATGSFVATTNDANADQSVAITEANAGALDGTTDFTTLGTNTVSVAGKNALITAAAAKGSDGAGLTYSYQGNNVTVTSGSQAGLSFALKADPNSTTTATLTNQTITAGSGLTMQIGANQGQTMSININAMDASNLGVAGVDLTTQDGAANAITAIDTATASVSAERSKLGAYQNRLEHTINNLGTSSQNVTAAEASIRDVDMAAEMTNFQKNNILQQAAQAMLAQANQQPQGVLQLLR